MRSRMPVPDGSVVHLWPFDLDTAFGTLGDPELLLGPEERVRVLAIPDARRRRRAIVARAALRAILARYLDQPPHALAITRGPAGKPALAQAAELAFSLAHSGQQALCVVGRGARPLGVDLELLRPFPDARNLAVATLPSVLAARITDLPTGRRARAFLTCWTRLEALGKADGGGIATGLEILTSSPDVSRLAEVSRWRGPVGRFWLEDLDMPLGRIGALAASGRDAIVVTLPALASDLAPGPLGVANRLVEAPWSDARPTMRREAALEAACPGEGG